MSKFAPLTSGAYTATDVIANAQRCVNLYPEANPPETQPAAPVTHYPTPGLVLKCTGAAAQVRCLYKATNGDGYAVIGSNVYFITQSFALTLVGTITNGSSTCYMADNGQVIVLVDGTANGYAIDMGAMTFGHITSTVDAFYGADRVDYLDTYFIFNRPGTNQFYISLSNVSYTLLTTGAGFDALDIAAKTGSADPIVTIIVMHKELWLIGSLTTEIWYNSGAADFTFQQLPGAYIEHGCVAPYSIAAQDLNVYWLEQDRQGQRIVVRGANYAAERISTHALEAAMATYPTVVDAVGYTFQQRGHIFYRLTFPSGNATWGFDELTQQWHQLAYTDGDGNLNRHRTNTGAAIYGFNLAGDWETGSIYSLSATTYTDNSQPISRIRSWPHSLGNLARVSYKGFIADMSTGNDDGTIDGSTYAAPPQVSLCWSDDRGVTFGNKLQQSLGAAGQYKTVLQWSRLGLARDRVFEVSWSAPTKTALNGAYVDAQLLGS